MAARLFGSVIPDRRDGYWCIQCTADGRRRKLRGYRRRSGKLLKFKSEEDATEALAEIRADIRNGIPESQAIADFLPVGTPQNLVEYHYRKFVYAKRIQGAGDPANQLTRQRVTELEGHLKRGHLDAIKHLPVQAIGYGELEDWSNSLLARGDLGANSVRHIVADFRTFLRWIARRRIISAAPEVPTIRTIEYVPNVPNANVQERVLAAIQWRRRGIFLARGLLGLRPIEARRLDLADYWFDPDTSRCRDIITVRKTKSRKYRLLPTHPDVSRWVREFHPISNLHAADADPIALFPNWNAYAPDKRWSGSAERRVVLEAMDDVGVKHRPNELLRHAFGTDAANRLMTEGYSCADVSRLLMAIMGHVEVKTSARYVRLATEGLERIVRRGEP